MFEMNIYPCLRPKYKISKEGICTPVKRDSYLKDEYIPLFKTTKYWISIEGIYTPV